MMDHVVLMLTMRPLVPVTENGVATIVQVNLSGLINFCILHVPLFSHGLLSHGETTKENKYQHF
jgi:hypothetical protein